MTMNPVVHFEMSAEDRARMSKFYNSVFGWKTDQLGADMGHYVVVETTETKNRMIEGAGRINGGFYQRMEDKSMNYPSVVIAVEDIHKHMKMVEKAGGKILGKPMEIPNVGTFVSFLDTEGNRVSMLQARKK